MTDLHVSRADAVPRVVLVTSPGCHYCEDAMAVLAALAETGRISLATVAADSAEGAALIATHRPGLFPLVALNGRFFSAGRLPRGKLARALRLDRAAVG